MFDQIKKEIDKMKIYHVVGEDIGEERNLGIYSNESKAKSVAEKHVNDFLIVHVSCLELHGEEFKKTEGWYKSDVSDWKRMER